MRNSWWLMVFLIPFVQCKSPQRPARGGGERLTPLQAEFLEKLKTLSDGELPSEALAAGKTHSVVTENLLELRKFIDGNEDEGIPMIGDRIREEYLGAPEVKGFHGNRGVDEDYLYSFDMLKHDSRVRYGEILFSLYDHNFHRFHFLEQFVKRKPPVGKYSDEDVRDLIYLLSVHRNNEGDSPYLVLKYRFNDESLTLSQADDQYLSFLEEDYGFKRSDISEYFDYEEEDNIYKQRGLRSVASALDELGGFTWVKDHPEEQALISGGFLISLKEVYFLD